MSLALWAYALLHLAQPSPGSAAGAVLLVAALLAVAVAAHLASGRALADPAGPRWAAAPVRRVAPLPRLFDPDAAGRPRPRAPGGIPPAA